MDIFITLVVVIIFQVNNILKVFKLIKKKKIVDLLYSNKITSLKSINKQCFIYFPVPGLAALVIFAVTCRVS